MAYSAGGLIEATDHNTRATSVNAQWGGGTGNAGYGQTSTISALSAGTVVTAANWATLISRLDSMRLHQSGVNSGITQPSAGGVITFLSAIDTQLTTINTNRLNVNARGTALPTNIGNPRMSNATAWTTSAYKEFYAELPSNDQARYFFNAGGLLTFYLTIPTTGFTVKSNEWGTFLNNQVGTITLGSNFCSRSGTGGDNLTQNTSTGYWNLTNSADSVLFNIGSTSATYDYGNNSISISARLGAQPNRIIFKVTLTDAATDSFNDTVNGTLSVFFGYTPPSTTYLANVWGTPTGTTTTNTQS